MSRALDIARRYFELSNNAELDEIAQFFTPSSTYSSTKTGVFLGASGIMAMQRAFFAGFDELRWTIHSSRETRPGVVMFEFSFLGTTTEGETVQRDGIEYIVVYGESIVHVEVRGRD